MAKDESRHPRPHASELRWGSRTPVELRREAETLQRFAGILVEQADAMDEANVKRVGLDGDKKFKNGTKLIDEYVKAVKKGLVDLE